MPQLKRLLQYVLPYWLHVLGAVLLLAAVGLLDAFRVLLIGPMLDRVLNPASMSENIALLTWPGTDRTIYLQNLMPGYFQNAWTLVAVALVGATVMKGLFDYLGTYLVNYAGFGMITDLRDRLYNRILRQSASFFHRHSTGTLLSTMVNDVEKVQYAMSTVLAEFLTQLFIFLFMVAVVIGLGGKYSLVLIVFLPFIIFSAARVGMRVRHATRRGQDRLADIQNILHETITGNRVVKAFGMERWEAGRFREAASRLFRANLRAVRAAAISSPLMDLFGAVAIALLLLLGRDGIKDGHFTLGTFFAFLVAVFKLYDPVRKFAVFNNNLQQALGASQEIFNFMDLDDEVREKPVAVKLPPFRGSIRFENVGFDYGERQILHEIELDVRPGEVLAIVGSSGAGKTTLVNLVPRFFDVTSGRLLIDGHDIRDVTVRSLRSQIGIVTQDTILFNDTVRNNIAYGRPQVPLEAVISAARAALAHDFIERMPQGYDTVIGEKGVRLSGGEKQRLAIARALLKDAPILVLDEATSALDAESEALVQSALHNLIAGRTVFVIAHRLSTVRRADRIIVLEQGRIVESGTHEDLLAKLGTYKRLYDLQFIDAAEAPRMAPS